MCFHSSSRTQFLHGIPTWALVWQNLLHVHVLSPAAKQNRRTEAVLHLNNRLTVPLKEKENCKVKYVFHPRFSSYNHFKGMGVYFVSPCYGYALNCHFVYLTLPGIRPLVMR